MKKQHPQNMLLLGSPRNWKGGDRVCSRKVGNERYKQVVDEKGCNEIKEKEWSGYLRIVVIKDLKCDWAI